MATAEDQICQPREGPPAGCKWGMRLPGVPAADSEDLPPKGPYNDGRSRPSSASNLVIRFLKQLSRLHPGFHGRGRGPIRQVKLAALQWSLARARPELLRVDELLARSCG
jgi:hypothetical protein